VLSDPLYRVVDIADFTAVVGGAGGGVAVVVVRLISGGVLGFVGVLLQRAATAAVAQLGVDFVAMLAAAFGCVGGLAFIVDVIAVVAAVVAFAALGFGPVVLALLLHAGTVGVRIGGGIAAVVGHLRLGPVMFVVCHD
jgi:hypothetical protein